MSEMINLRKLIEFEVRSWDSPGIPCLSLDQIGEDISSLGHYGWNIETVLQSRKAESEGWYDYLPKERYNQEAFRSIVFPYHKEGADAAYFSSRYVNENEGPPTLTTVFANAQEKHKTEMANLRKLFEYEVRTRGILTRGVPCITMEDMLRDIEDLKKYNWDVESLLSTKKASGKIRRYLAKEKYNARRLFRIITCEDDFDNRYRVPGIWESIYNDDWKFDYNDKHGTRYSYVSREL